MKDCWWKSYWQTRAYYDAKKIPPITYNCPQVQKTALCLLENNLLNSFRQSCQESGHTF